MPLLRNIASGIRSLFQKKRADRELDEELRGFMDMAAEENVKQGRTQKDALRAVRLERGSLEAAKELVRSAGWESLLETFWQDLCYGLRQLRRNPGFTVVAVLTLALGIGANTAIFSVMDATLLRPLPYKNPGRLVMLWGTEPGRPRQMPFSSPNFLDFENRNRVFENMAAFDSAGLVLSGIDNPEAIHVGRVTPSFFKVLEVQPKLGRGFLAEEGEAGREHVVMLSYALWRQRFASDPAILGKMVQLSGTPYVVVGVLPRDFDFSIPDYYGPMDAWVPAVLSRDNALRKNNYLNVIARLKPGVTLQQAQSDLDTIVAALAHEYSAASQASPDLWTQPEANEASGVMSAAKLEPLHDEIFGNVSPLLWILFGAVGFVLLIACANMANLQLARASSRQKEIAVRRALGASHGRVVRQLLTESVLLALLGGMLSLLVVLCVNRFLTGLAGLPKGTAITIGFSVVAYCLLLSVLAGLLFGLAPTFRTSLAGEPESLKEGGNAAIPGGARRLRSFLTISEVALSMILLIGAGLLIRSFVGLLNVNPGFEMERVLTLSVVLPRYSYPDATHQAAFYTELLDRIAALPGVTGAAAINDLPLTRNSDSDSFRIERRSSTTGASLRGSCQDRLATPNYFRVMNIPLIEGRTFTKDDAGSAPPVVVVSQSFVRRFFPNGNPIGQRLTFGEATAAGSWATIVGVVGDVRDLGLDSHPDMNIYAPYEQKVLPYNPLPFMFVIVETTRNPNRLISAVLAAMHDIDRNLPLPAARPMTEVYAASISARRFNMLLLTLFAGIATILAGIGIYGVISYSVARRTHEIGIRMALGANSRNVLALILGQGLLMASLGVGTGLAGAFILTRVLKNMLFGITPTDFTTFAGVSVLLVSIALLASYIPARRAMKVDPMVALRYE
jgi:putative ABC transport system permease protein